MWKSYIFFAHRATGEDEDQVFLSLRKTCLLLVLA
jgi:hypothetical protein